LSIRNAKQKLAKRRPQSRTSLSACKAKEAFPDEASCTASCRTEVVRIGHLLYPYRCNACRQWHKSKSIPK